MDSKVEDGFNSKPAYARFIVLIAGVFMNFLLAFIIMFSSIYSNGKYIPSEKPIIGDIFKEAKAYKYLQKKDKILEIEGIKIENWNDIGKNLKLKNENEEVQMKI